MYIKRLQLDVEFESGSLHVFHTAHESRNGDPPTLVSVNGKEFEGEVSFIQIGDDYNIRIKKLER